MVINQSIARYFRSQSGFDPVNVTSVLVAPTGKAAFNINGSTIHSFFQIPINHKGPSTPFSDDIALSLIYFMYTIVVFIIDEISMFGSRLFHYLNTRFQQILESYELFGGKSVLFFGDLKQLQPIGDKWIFEII